MSERTRLEVRQREIRAKLTELGKADSPSDEQRSEMDKLTTEAVDIDRKLNILDVTKEEERSVEVNDAETNEIRELRKKSQITSYIAASLGGRSVTGPEAEFNAAVGIDASEFPVELLVPDEMRSVTDADGQVTQQPWIQRLMAGTASGVLGVTSRSVGVGVQSVPQVATGPDTFTQVAKGASATESTWTVSTIQSEPKRASVNFKFSMEDIARLPSLEEQLTSDMRRAVAEKMDRMLFLGDDSPTGTAADIVGFQTATITEKTIKQADKTKGEKWLALLAELLDGLHAESMNDVRLVVSTSTNQAFLSTVMAPQVSTQTVSSFLRENNLSWTARNSLAANTSADSFAGYVGLQKGIAGAAVHNIWNAGSLIKDVYNTAGETTLVLNVLHDFVIPRATSFRRLKYVA
ncbi:MAG: hypothetical protein OXL36_14315 [Bryobacterales bacterium]|nr:hypothetical protein [Bryobacterales bacterium]MDE0293697.1 hypothetical protein [Bryobacterales bacterium]